MRILVTGGAGFIGYNLITKLLEQKHDVIGIDNLSAGEPAKRREKALNRLGKERLGREIIYNLDIHAPNLLRSTLTMVKPPFDAIAHLAAPISVPESYQNPRKYLDEIVGGTVEVLEAAKALKIKRVVLASTAAIYGDVAGLPTEESQFDPRLPTSPYGIAKRAAEDLMRNYAHTHDLETISLRFFNAFGPEQDPAGYAGAVCKFLQQVRLGEPPMIYGDGKQTRDFVYVDDLTDAVTAALSKDIHSGRAYNIASGKSVSINDLAREAIAVNGNKEIEPLHVKQLQGEIRDSLADISAAREALKWEPKTSLKDGLAKTYAWLASSGSAP